MKVVFLHGWPLDEWMWEPQLRALERTSFEPIAPRLYGRGSSIDGWAAQLLREQDGPLVAVGASMGGYCALALARRAPERVVGMLLAGSRADADDMDRRRYRNEVIGRLHEHGIDNAPDTMVPANELATAQEAMRDRLDLTGVVSSFGGPVLVVVGDEDELVSVDEARELASTALVGSLEIFEGAGHFVSQDEPQRFTTVLLEFLEQWRT